MKRLAPLALLVACAHAPSGDLVPARGAHPGGRDVSIVRDDWGIPHVFGKTDADAVLGLAYAQAEDDFDRVETNYLAAMGRLAEAQGEAALWRDVRRRLFTDPETTQREYAGSPPWLRALMDAWAEGLNLYLATHPQTRPRVLARFEPWMALAFSEGSIGDDIDSSVSLDALEAFYGGRGPAAAPVAARGDGEVEGGSNGIAIAPSNTTAGRALLLLNPHTSFYFRAEAQVASDEGLDAYGAVTWGQFFLYQGFNERLGWMHTSSGVDTVDEYRESVERRGDRVFYRYGGEERPVATSTLSLAYRTPSGPAHKELTVYATHHGPVVRAEDGKWITVRLMHRPVEALAESFLRMKARDLASFEQTMQWRGNSSNNTVYADADGHVGYFHPSFVARRDDRFDWRRPVDGSDPATEWQGTHGLEDSPHVVDPRVGWIQNTNDWPWSAAGPDSPRRESFPRYMDAHGENGRGVHAVLVLTGRRDFSIDALVAAAFDSRLPVFDELVPLLVAAYDRLPATDPRRDALAQQVQTLRTWDRRWGAASEATTLAVAWGEELYRDNRGSPPRRGSEWVDFVRTGVAPDRLLAALESASARLAGSFGTWRIAWGDVNRLQRTGAGREGEPERFDDAAPSIPVPFTSAQWGSLAAFEARQWASRPTYDAPVDPRARKRYGVGGNSFVAVVEFGPGGPRARAVVTGGESGHPGARHFEDQSRRYAAGDLRDVYFTRQDLARHTERTYRPGELAPAAAAPAAEAAPPDEATVVRWSHDLLDAFDRGDTPAVTAALAPGFVHFEGSEVTPRDKELAELARRKPDAPHIGKRTWKNEHVSAGAREAVFVGEALEHAAGNDVHGGNDFDGWYTLVWVRDGDAWKALLWTWKQGGQASASESWNEIYRNGIGFEKAPNRLLQDTVAAVKPGAALDVAMGQGRNALYLASRGWKVTGVDFADDGLQAARAEAARRHLALDAVHANIDTYDFGVARWDLVTMIYATDHVKWIERIKPSLRRGGLFVLEYFHQDEPGGDGFATGQLAALFKDGFDVLRDEVVEGTPDWGSDHATLVRFVARKR